MTVCKHNNRLDLCMSCRVDGVPGAADGLSRSTKVSDTVIGDVGILTVGDITARRHGNNLFSAKANPSSDAKQRDCRAIYEEYLKLGSVGDIAENVYRPLGMPPQTGSARCSDLKRAGLLVGTGRRGKTLTGSAAEVLVADVYATKEAA